MSLGLYAFCQIPVVVKSAIGFSWYSWAVKDDLLFDELDSANLNYLADLAFTTIGVWFNPFNRVVIRTHSNRSKRRRCDPRQS